MSRGPSVECYDIGGTQIRGAIVTPEGIDGCLTDRSERGDPEALFAQIRDMSARLGGGKSRALSIALPGPVSGTVMMGSRPLEIEEPVDFARGLKDLHPGRSLFIGNDLNFAVRAELRRGAGRTRRNFVLLTLSTGIGAGVVVESTILDRRVEIGHTVLELDPTLANDCQGHRGCWVAQASGTGIEAALSRAGKKVDAKGFFAAPEPGLLARIRRYNAQGIGNLINAYDPEAVLVMGSIGRQQFDLVVPSARELEAFTALRPVPPVERSLLGDDIGLYGAYEAAAEGLSR